MSAPDWVDSAVRDFGRSAGVSSLSLGEKGVASISLENGVKVVFEHVADRLAVTATVPAATDPETVARVLLFANPMNTRGRRIRSGYLAGSSRALFMSSIPDGEVTLPALNSAFAAVMGAAAETGGAK
jgi:type III secretion system chaperone SycN